MGTVHTCHQVNQLRPLHFVTPLLVLPRESESGTMLVSTAFNFFVRATVLIELRWRFQFWPISETHAF